MAQGEGGVRLGGGNPLSSNSSATAWNSQTPFHRMEVDCLRMVYVNFHKPICSKDFSVIGDLSARISQKPSIVLQSFFGEIVAGDVSFQMYPRIL